MLMDMGGSNKLLQSAIYTRIDINEFPFFFFFIIFIFIFF